MQPTVNVFLKNGPLMTRTLWCLAVVVMVCAAEQMSEPQEARKCVPVLNFAPQSVQDSLSAAHNQSLEAAPESLSFAVGDVEMPLSQTGGTVQTAMKLLSTFDSQMFGDEYDAEPDDNDESGRPRQHSIKFLANKLHIAGLNVTMLNVHLYESGEPKFGLGLNIANTTLTGQFRYDGPAPALLGGDLYARLAGHYRMSIDNLLLTATSNLTKERQVRAPTQTQLQLQTQTQTQTSGQEPAAEYRLRTNEFRMNVSNLGYINIEILDARDSSRPTSSYVLKMLQRVLQKTIKRTYEHFEAYIRRTLELEGRRFLDCELTRFTPILSADKSAPSSAANSSTSTSTGTSTTSLDDLGRIISSEVARSQLGQMALPSFEYQRSVLATSALIEFANGSLAGLENIRLNGETRVKLQDEHLIVNASLGWLNLRPHYNWTLYLGASAQRRQDHQLANVSLATLTPTPTQPRAPDAGATDSARPTARGFVAFNIKAVDFEALIRRSLGAASRVTVDELTIRRLEAPKMDIGGLPGMNRLTRGLVNFFMGRLKQRLVSSIQPALKQELERVLNRLLV